MGDRFRTRNEYRGSVEIFLNTCEKVTLLCDNLMNESEKLIRLVEAV